MRFLATADLHLNSREDLALLERILNTARRRDCRAVLIAGDLLDTPFPQEGVNEGVAEQFAQWGGPIYLVAGNHDPLAIAPLYTMLPANVTLFPEGMTCHTLAPGLRLYGCSALREQSMRRPASQVRVPAGEMGILLAHGHFEGRDFQPVLPEDVAASNLSLCILGHIHKGEQRQIGRCRVLVPGIPQGRGWDETGDKFVYIIDADPKDGITAEPQSVATRFFREQTVYLTGCADTEAILQKMEAVQSAPNTETALVLTGEPEEDPAEAIELYGRKGYTNRVVDRTVPVLSVERLKEQNTLQGAFVRKALLDIEQADPAQRPALEAALRLGLRAFKEAQR